MNTVWSGGVQGIGTLYHSRALRFDDRFKDWYVPSFAIPDGAHILEIGCGPGALAQSLKRWYPNSSVTAIDRDTAFIDYAKSVAPDIAFQEGDATALGFPDASFDVTISNTVSEHVPTEAFYQEQRRVLRDGGVCLMLSARRGVNIVAPCIRASSEIEDEVWSRTEELCKAYDQDNHVGAYGMNEMQHPIAMAENGFRDITADYAVINLTPDDPRMPREMALAIINAHRQTALDAIGFLPNVAGSLVKPDELDEMRRQVNLRYDQRIALYNAGEKQWDTTVCVTMILRGVK